MARKTVQVALRDAAQQLVRASDAPEIDAERLLLKVLGRDESSWLIAHGDLLLTDDHCLRLNTMIERRQSGEPLAYILGEWGFYGRTFEVSPDVLVPRPATEALVDRALKFVHLSTLHNIERLDGAFTIADVGTGSGCIAITLAAELENRNWKIEILATDISPTALEVARRNAERHQVSNKIEWLEGDMLEPLADRKVDLIVSNPPYVPSAEIDSPIFKHPLCKKGVDTIGLQYEPRIALDGGEDGQRYVEQIKKAGVPVLLETTGGQILKQTYPLYRE